MITLAIKKRTESGQWQNIQAAEIAGKTLLIFFQESIDREIVVEVNLDGRRLFFCGTDHWLQRMKTKGEAVTFDYAIQRLKQINPQLLAEVLPEMDIVTDVFEGATIIEHKLEV